jgi:RNA-directed DNA polymerase
MNVASATCAPTGVIDWDGINWSQANQNVKRLQSRIVKATQQNRWNKVKALQHLLTHSFSGKALAVQRVTSNKGKRTPGVDRIIWDTPKAKADAISQMRQRGYQPLPLRRVYVAKKSGKTRPLGIPPMKDRSMQALYKLALDPVAETLADPNSYGFRTARSSADAAEQCFIALAKHNSAQWILEGDIKGCFDNISHDWMLTNIPMDKVILRKWLKAGFIEKGRLFPTYTGTPQGRITSAVLANLTLDGLETMLKKHFKGQKVNCIRYADDFLVTGSSKELLQYQVKPMVEDFMAIRGLMLSPEKTKITNIADGFDFLGWNFRKYKGKLLRKPSKDNLAAVKSKISEIISSNKTAKQENLIRQLNPVIRGWANYHRHAVAKRAFSSLDRQIWIYLWQWAKRRHPNKGARWIKKKYFTSTGNRNWVFGCRDKDGKAATLVKASDTAIVRHVKIKGGANPFDPRWEAYFKDRIGRQMSLKEGNREQVTRLWHDQNGNCQSCGEAITSQTRWMLQHIAPRAIGGPDTHSNRVLVHESCHRLVQTQRLSAVQPGSERGLSKA